MRITKEGTIFVSSLIWILVLMFIPWLLALAYNLWFCLLYIINLPLSCLPLLIKDKSERI